MIDLRANLSMKALTSRFGMQGFFFRVILSAVVMTSVCGGFASSLNATVQELVIEFVDADKLDFRIRVRAADGKKLPAKTTVNLWLDGSDQKSDPSVLGKITSEENSLLFTPRFPLQRGKSFNVVVLPGGKESAKACVTLDVPAKETKPTEVEEIYPSSDKVPENLLRFYVQFSAPMRQGDIYKHLQILKEDGTPVVLPFLEIEQELWSRDSTRLTLLLDPGRIKRGLKPREDMGPILVSGCRYSLVIDGKWKDANGNPIGDDVEKKFLATDEDHVQPNPLKWKVVSPKPDSKDGLTVTFDGQLDWSMLFRSIVVMSSEGSEVAGSISVSENESTWTFTPEQAWNAGGYSLSIDPNLEDAAGNSVGRQFDVDVFEKTEASDKAIPRSVPFTIK